MLMALLALFLAGCGQPGGKGGPTPSAAPSSGTGSPACALITPEIAAKAVPGIMPAGQNSPAKPPGSKAYQCLYSTKSASGMTALSVALTSPASDADISKAKSTSDCSPVAGIGDFACLQWTGYFRGEAGGASANVVLTAVRGNEVLEMPYVTGPPMAGGGVPDGNAMGRALSQAAVDAGWGSGTPLGVPAAPPVGPPATTNNSVCALVSPQKVQQAFGAKAPPQVLPYEVSCRYTFGELGTPGPDSLIFSIEVLKGAAPGPVGPRPAWRAAGWHRGQSLLLHDNGTRWPQVPPSGRQRPDYHPVDLRSQGPEHCHIRGAGPDLPGRAHGRADEGPAHLPGARHRVLTGTLRGRRLDAPRRCLLRYRLRQRLHPGNAVRSGI